MRKYDQLEPETKFIVWLKYDDGDYRIYPTNGIPAEFDDSVDAHNEAWRLMRNDSIANSGVVTMSALDKIDGLQALTERII